MTPAQGQSCQDRAKQWHKQVLGRTAYRSEISCMFFTLTHQALLYNCQSGRRRAQTIGWRVRDESDAVTRGYRFNDTPWIFVPWESPSRPSFFPGVAVKLKIRVECSWTVNLILKWFFAMIFFSWVWPPRLSSTEQAATGEEYGLSGDAPTWDRAGVKARRAFCQTRIGRGFFDHLMEAKHR